MGLDLSIPLGQGRKSWVGNACGSEGTPSAVCTLPPALTLSGSRSRFCTGCPGEKICSSSMMCTLGPTPTALCSRPSPGARAALRRWVEPTAHVPTAMVPGRGAWPAAATHQCPGTGRRRCGAGQRRGARSPAGSGPEAVAAAGGFGPARPSGSGP